MFSRSLSVPLVKPTTSITVPDFVTPQRLPVWLNPLVDSAMTNSIDEIDIMDVIFVTGSNTTETHPVIGAKIKQRQQKGALIVAEPRRIELAKYADVFLQIKPELNVPWLLNE